MRQGEERLLVVRDTAFQAAAGAPSPRTLCQRGAWQDRRLVETVRSMLRLGSHRKKVMPRGWEDCYARLACTMAAVTVLVQWHGFCSNAPGFVPLSIAELSL